MKDTPPPPEGERHHRCWGASEDRGCGGCDATWAKHSKKKKERRVFFDELFDVKGQRSAHGFQLKADVIW